jgi:acetylornithine deacetylase
MVAAAGLRELERRLNRPGGDAVFFAEHEHPYNLNLGVAAGGVWPSSVPVEVTLRGRLGFGRDTDPGAAQELLTATLVEHAPAVEVSFEGFRAPAYWHDPDDPFGQALAAAHTAVAGSPPRRHVLTFTTDARHTDGPCFCYGPAAGNIHGTDEWVDLDSLRRTARTVAHLILDWSG